MNHIPPFKASVKGRRDPRVERTRSAFREALLTLLRERSFEQITVRELTSQAGTGYATFFRHYADKGLLLEDLATSAINELLSRSLPILDAVDTKASCVALCSYVDEHRELWRTLLTGGAAGHLREEFVRQAREIAAVRSGPQHRSSSWLPGDIAVVFGVSATVEVLTWWLEAGQKQSVEQAAAILDRLVIAPILNS